MSRNCYLFRPFLLVIMMGGVSIGSCYVPPSSFTITNNNHPYHHPITTTKRSWTTTTTATSSTPLCSSSSSSTSRSSSSSSSGGGSSNSLDIEDIFSTWFSEYPKSTRDPFIYHSLFGTLRGMEWNGNMADVPSKRRVIANIPRQMVVQSDNFNNDWDVQLTTSLWTEFCQKEKSPLYGYCQLLLNTNSKKDSTAANYDYTGSMTSQNSVSPNAIRHWDEESKALLGATMAGEKLVNIEQLQMQAWKQKYDAYLIATTTPTSIKSTEVRMSWDQFLWIMEVVHSRAFSGNFGVNPSDDTSPFTVVAKNAAFPLVAAVGGILASQQQLSLEPSLPVLLGLGVVAVIPLVFQLLQEGNDAAGNSKAGGGKSAVLLPLIDSANHREEADSAIQYDPISNAFQLSVGPNCLVRDETNQAQDPSRTQLFISYGKKKDSELLLNYGFLANVPCSDGNDDEARKSQRISLATEYIKRNR